MATATDLTPLMHWQVDSMTKALEWWGQWAATMQPSLVPRSVSEPILPGWTFGNSITVNENNSTSPETERQILAQLSYGSQLGVLIDALVALIKERPAAAPKLDALERMLELAEHVQDIKKEATQTSAQRLIVELTRLKRYHQTEFGQIMAALDDAPVAPAK